MTHKKKYRSKQLTYQQSERKNNISSDIVQRLEKKLLVQIRWFIGLGVSIFGILIFLIISLMDKPSRIDIERYTQRYDPIFRKVLLDKAYSILSDVHLTEIQFKPELKRNLVEIRNTLTIINAFKNANNGLERILFLLESLGSGQQNSNEEDFLRTDPLRDQSLDMNPQERAFFITFQGLLYIRKMRAVKNQNEYQQYLALAKERLLLARKLNPGISNAWNGLGICILDEAHDRGQLDLIPRARDCFRIAYELHRSPINYAAEINNLSYANMIWAFYTSISIVREEDGFLYLTYYNKKKIRNAVDVLNKQLESFNVASLYDPQALSVLLSKAECYCHIALCNRALETKVGNEIKFSGLDKDIEKAMDIIRQAKARGFTDWSYLFSRIWISQTVLRIEDFREELITYINP
jgi:hypothetical protein